MYSYSKTTNAFYLNDRMGNYKLSRTWPDDAKEIDDVISAEFMSNPPNGKRREPDKNGLPSWVDILPQIDGEQTASAEAMKLRLKAKSDAEIAWRQDAVDAGMSTAGETAELAEWKKYRVLLMRVDTAAPVWPPVPGEQATKNSV